MPLTSEASWLLDTGRPVPGPLCARAPFQFLGANPSCVSGVVLWALRASALSGGTSLWRALSEGRAGALPAELRGHFKAGRYQ